MSIKFGTQRTNAEDIQTQDKTKNQNTDQGKTCRQDDQDKKVMLGQSKMKPSAQLEKKSKHGVIYTI